MLYDQIIIMKLALDGFMTFFVLFKENMWVVCDIYKLHWTQHNEMGQSKHLIILESWRQK